MVRKTSAPAAAGEAAEMIVAEPAGAMDQGDHVDDAEEEDVTFMPIEKLCALGVNAGDVKKAKEAGYHTVNCLMMNTKKALLNIKGLSEAKIDKLVDAAQKAMPGLGFVTGQQMLEKRKEVVKLSTGSKALDEVMGGGVRSMEITEAIGEFRTGKTQICHTLCVTTQLPREMGGGAGKVAYIDTEGTFRADRIIPIAERFGVDPYAVLENIVVARVYTHEHQLNQLFLICAKMVEEPFRLIIIDSIMALFRVDFCGRGELSERQQKVGHMMSRLQKIAEEFNVAVFITNHVMSDPGGGMTFVQDPKKPCGGHVLAHASTVRLSLRKGKGEQRIAKVFDSPDMPENEATYTITQGGITDVQD